MRDSRAGGTERSAAGGAGRVSRVLRPRAEALRIYDRISGCYGVLEGFWERHAQETALSLLNIRERENVLEIGPGTGRCLISHAARLGGGGCAVGLDLSPGMLRRAADAVERSGHGARVSLVRGDAVALPFRDGAFDAVFMSFTLDLFDTPDIPLVLGECKRTLKPDGRIVCAALSGATSRNIMRAIYEWGHTVLPRLLDCRPIHVREAVEAAGFRARRVEFRSAARIPVEIVLASNKS
jgi:ubiquinone/menaquinone biosynthesis C-methylase UbiE